MKKKALSVSATLVLLIALGGCTAPQEPKMITLEDVEPLVLKSDDFAIEGELGDFSASMELERIEDGVSILHLSISAPHPAQPPRFELNWKVPSDHLYGFWAPKISLDKANYYNSRLTTGASRYAPVIAVFDPADGNRMTFACSDSLHQVEIGSYVIEEDANLYSYLVFFPEASPPMGEYSVQIRLDTRPIPYHRALADVSDWWAGLEGYKPAAVPDAAKRPLYSTWYSFHQSITADEVVEQCRLASEIGCEVVIVDDGWQTLDSQRGYAFCGDWLPERIGDMRNFVDRVHQLGMKFVLWYSVPLVGENSRNYSRFRGKYLTYWEGQGASVLDPRFPEVREFIINTYERALQDWGLDGFKLDFIGMFRPYEDTRFVADGGRDFASVDKAVDRLMTDIMARLRALKPDIMIEFRQPYIGPLMRKYGNMFRATDCPNMEIVNRVRTTDIRLICGDTAVHSDMFMWHNDDPVETAALQVLNILFAVPQVSVKLDVIPADHREMLAFWIGYWNENRGVLLDGDFIPTNPSANYPLLTGLTPGKTIHAVYIEFIVPLGSAPAIDIVNAKAGPWLVADYSGDPGDAEIAAFDCRGMEIYRKSTRLERGVRKFAVPPSGLLTIRMK